MNIRFACASKNFLNSGLYFALTYFFENGILNHTKMLFSLKIYETKLSTLIIRLYPNIPILPL